MKDAQGRRRQLAQVSDGATVQSPSSSGSWPVPAARVARRTRRTSSPASWGGWPVVGRLALLDLDEPASGFSTLPRDGRTIVVGHRPGRGKSLLINGHIGVVPPGTSELWSSDPFAPMHGSGRVAGWAGRGDMNGGVETAALAREALTRHIRRRCAVRSGLCQHWGRVHGQRHPERRKGRSCRGRRRDPRADGPRAVALWAGSPVVRDRRTRPAALSRATRTCTAASSCRRATTGRTAAWCSGRRTATRRHAGLGRSHSRLGRWRAGGRRPRPTARSTWGCTCRRDA